MCLLPDSTSPSEPCVRLSPHTAPCIRGQQGNDPKSRSVKFSVSVGANGRSPLPITSSGFHAIVGNPPFMGGKKITGNLSTAYREYIVEFLGKNQKGSADLCAYFFLRSKDLIKDNGNCGLVATNTIAQGDTREVGLDQIVNSSSQKRETDPPQPPLARGEQEKEKVPLIKGDLGGSCIIYRAVPSRKWEGSAALEVAYVWFKKGQYLGEFYLDDQPVEGITSYLTNVGKTEGKPYKLIANQNKSFMGSIVLGNGFVLTQEEAQNLIAKNPKNKDVLFPYLGGQDFNTNFDQAPSRWVINFFDWALSADHDDKKKPKGKPYASDYPDCLEIVERLVKPQRDEVKRQVYREKWWQFAERCPALYETIKECDRVLFHGFTSKYVCFAFAPTGIVYAGPHIVIALQGYKDFALLQSNFHNFWVLHNSSSMKTDVRYAPSDAFETFPFPQIKKGSEIEKKLERIGEEYYHHRQAIMTKNQEGLTKTYNRFHNPDETDSDIIKLRQLHREMDNLVAQAYGWLDLALTPKPSPTERGENGGLNHDFHETKQGLRYTICEEARREILDRLLQLNIF